MDYRIEFSPSALADLDLIERHLFDSYIHFGDAADIATAKANDRISGILAGIGKLSRFPQRGVSDDALAVGLRHLTINDAITYFDLDGEASTVLVRAVFFGGQDHQTHMLRRLLGG